MNNLPMKYWSFVSVDLELTNRCVNNCLICPRESIKRPKGFIEKKTFEVISNALVKQGSFITFCGMGDPLMHPGVFDFINDIRKNGGSVGIVVNPNSLNRDVSTKLVKARPNFIKVSIPSLRKIVFEKLCPQLTLEHDLDLTRELIKKAKGYVGIHISGILTKINSDEKESFEQFWKSEGISAEMRPCHSRGGNLVMPDIHIPDDIGLKGRACGLFAFHTFITWQGDILACCHDLTGETRLGNLVVETVDMITNKKQKIIEKKRPFYLCLSCDEPLRRLPIPKGLPPEDRNSRKRFFRSLKKYFYT